jgi:hypothetical protein
VNGNVIVPPSSLHFLVAPEYEIQETATEFDQATLPLYVIRVSVADTVLLVTPVTEAGDAVRVNVLVGDVIEVIVGVDDEDSVFVGLKLGVVSVFEVDSGGVFIVIGVVGVVDVGFGVVCEVVVGCSVVVVGSPGLPVHI